MDSNYSLRIGTASGTLLSIIGNLHSEDILRTAILACVGAVVGFFTTLLLKKFMERKA